MERVASLAILACIALCAGCMTASTAPKAPAATPSLLGNWTGSVNGYSEGMGYRDFGGGNVTMSVTDQKGRFFSGLMTLPRVNGTRGTEGFAGIISNDGTNFRVVEYDTHEHDDGWILSDNTIEMIHIYDEEPQSILLYSLRHLSQAPAATPGLTPSPSLLGNWTGSVNGYTEGSGYRDFGGVNITMSVTDQKDRFFSGHMILPKPNGTTITEGFAGAISLDGKSFRIVEYDTHEHDDGWILSDNTIEMIFMHDEEPQKIILESFRRT